MRGESGVACCDGRQIQQALRARARRLTDRQTAWKLLRHRPSQCRACHRTRALRLADGGERARLLPTGVTAAQPASVKWPLAQGLCSALSWIVEVHGAILNGLVATASSGVHPLRACRSSAAAPPARPCRQSAGGRPRPWRQALLLQPAGAVPTYDDAARDPRSRLQPPSPSSRIASRWDCGEGPSAGPNARVQCAGSGGRSVPCSSDIDSMATRCHCVPARGDDGAVDVGMVEVAQAVTTAVATQLLISSIGGTEGRSWWLPSA